MGYIVETKQEAVAQSVLLTTEQGLASAAIGQARTEASAEKKAEVYFQIED
jgi:hypothetical protein